MTTLNDRLAFPWHGLLGLWHEWRTRRLTAQALRWRERLLEDTDGTGAAAFTGWLLKSPNHIRAVLELTAFDEELARWLGHPPLAAVAAAVPVPMRKRLDEATPDRRTTGARPSRVARWQIAAAIAMVILVSVPFVTRSSATASASYVSAIGQQERLRLDDGSIVTLNTDSKVTVRLAAHERRVTLVRGEALFDPAPDSARPFRVSVGRATIDDIGTQFNVRHTDGDEFTVLVSEGRVRVSPAGGGVAVELSAGDSAQLSTRTARLVVPVTRLDASEVGQRLYWKEGHLFFNGQTLKAVVAEMNRYSTRRLVIEDPSIANVNIGGVFSTGDPVGFAEALATLEFCDADPKSLSPDSRTIRLVRHVKSPAPPTPSR